MIIAIIIFVILLIALGCAMHEKYKSVVSPNVGDVEITEADGNYAVRQYGWREEHRRTEPDTIAYKQTYVEFGYRYIETDLKWHYFNDDCELVYSPRAMSHEDALRVAKLLKQKYADYIATSKRIEEDLKREKAFEDSLRNGKVVDKF